jgi:hypothetical protein
LDPVTTKSRSEAEILKLGGSICAWLPWIEPAVPKSERDVVSRLLTMHALVQLSFRAPKYAIREWLEENDLGPSLSKREVILLGTEAELDEQSSTSLYWYIEAIWALAWAGSLVDELSVIEPVSPDLAKFLPDIENGEDSSALRGRFRLRPTEELFGMLDLYFRAHWYARDGHLNRYSTVPFDLDVIMERRKALEWVADRDIEDWDDTPECT